MGGGFGGVGRKIFGTVDRVAVSARACLNHDGAGPLPLAWVGVAYGPSGLDHAFDFGRRAFFFGKTADKRAVARATLPVVSRQPRFQARVTPADVRLLSCELSALSLPPLSLRLPPHKKNSSPP